MRVVPKPALKGSQRWLQQFVEHRPDLLQVEAIGPINWVSPLRSDDFAEYRDGCFLEKVNLPHLVDELAAFWPARGPQWDALGTSGQTIVLVEAKAHVGELLSPASEASPGSLARIDTALHTVRSALNVTGGAEWSQYFYQLANRMAHLHFLRTHGVDARLLLVGFVGDHDMHGPQSAAEWAVAYQIAEYAMGLPRKHVLSRFIHHVHPKIADFYVQTSS